MKPHHNLTPKTKLVFKFIFALGVWSFLVLGLIKINNDQILPQQVIQEMPINSRLLLQKESKWTAAEGTPKTTERFMQMLTAEEVLVDSRNGESRFFLIKSFIARKCS